VGKNEDNQEGPKTILQQLFEYLKDNNYYLLYLIASFLLVVAISNETNLGPVSFKGTTEGTERWVFIGAGLIFLLAGLTLHLDLLSLRGRNKRSTLGGLDSEARIERTQDRGSSLPDFLSQHQQNFERTGLDFSSVNTALEDYKQNQSQGKYVVDWMGLRQAAWIRETVNEIYTQDSQDALSLSIEESDFRTDLEKLCQIVKQNILDLKYFTPKERGFDLKDGRSFLYTRALKRFKDKALEAASIDLSASSAKELFERHINQLIENINT